MLTDAQSASTFSRDATMRTNEDFPTPQPPDTPIEMGCPFACCRSFAQASATTPKFK